MDRFSTHEVTNQPPPLQDTNLFETDRPLREGIERAGAGWAVERLQAFGAVAGSARFRELGHLANRHEPELRTHDRAGHRIDEVEFHPAWHEVMSNSSATMLSIMCQLSSGAPGNGSSSGSPQPSSSLRYSCAAPIAKVGIRSRKKPRPWSL